MCYLLASEYVVIVKKAPGAQPIYILINLTWHGFAIKKIYDMFLDFTYSADTKKATGKVQFEKTGKDAGALRNKY
jgi:hypothetical protein